MHFSIILNMNKPFIKKLILILLTVALIFIATGCTVTEKPILETFKLMYVAEGDGNIIGAPTQYLTSGTNSFPVTATANEGWAFSGWSDGIMNPTRSETNILADMTITAIFRKNNFKYNYNEATGNNSVYNITLEPEDYLQKTLAVPVREGYEFDGWYSDWLFKTRVSDKNGNILIDDELFKNKSINLYAKWNNKNAPIYPILMVFVTEVDAELKSHNGTFIPVKYSMTETERKVLELLAIKFEEYLDAMLNGSVDFKVDTFFTTKVVGTRSFTPGIQPTPNPDIWYYEHSLEAYQIPELGGLEWPESNCLPSTSEIEGDGILSKYKSIITTFSMNDKENLLHVTGGSSFRKYANIHMESMFPGFLWQGEKLDFLLDPNDMRGASYWIEYMTLYLHEFTHSVEQYLENKAVNSIDFHDVNSYYSINTKDKGQSGVMSIEIMRQYLLYKTEINGEKFGIPPDFWYNDHLIV